VSVERIFHCDWRECGAHVRTAAAEPSSGFLSVREHDGRAAEALHFCSWDCVLKYAAEKPPTERVAFELGG